jgi:hypothetical protein
MIINNVLVEQVRDDSSVIIGEKGYGNTVSYVFKDKVLFVPNKFSTFEEIKAAMNIMNLVAEIKINKEEKVLVINDYIGYVKAMNQYHRNIYYLDDNKDMDCQIANKVNLYYNREEKIEFDTLIYFGDDLNKIFDEALNTIFFKRMVIMSVADIMCESLVMYGIYVYSEKKYYETSEGDPLNLNYVINKKITNEEYSFLEFVKPEFKDNDL